MSDRLYAGLRGDQRAAARRRQLLDAALEVFGTTGWSASTVHDVCRTAGLSPRYFYASFESREALFLALFRQIAVDVEGAVRTALTTADDPQARATAVLTSLTGYFTSDPRRIRVALMESLATEEFRTERREMLGTFSDLGARLMRPLRDRPTLSRRCRLRLEASAAVLTGGLVEALIAWDDERGADQPSIDHLTGLYTAAARL